MLTIAFPQPQFEIRKKESQEQIFDIVRKKWIRLTPEEWVRQNFLSYLIDIKTYPSSLQAVEKEIYVGERKKRCDIVVYKNASPWMIIECKQPDVPLTEDTLMQAIRYNLADCCSYLIITNGKETRGWRIDEKGVSELNEFPDWQ